ncbi:MAG TPA: cyclic nucleotide-binding domain-containing protein [Anaerolineales bacterium]|nr:cyclic nucleotide-binding domain-containing protein [Anaerolineales bacterium]
MISPELLRRYPYFGQLNDDQLKAIAMIAEEKTYPKGILLIKENTPATRLMLLVEGDIDLVYSGGGEGAISNALVGSIAPGEVFGVSTLIEPYLYTASSRATVPIKVIEIDGIALRALMVADQKLGYSLMCNTAKAVLERLKYTQVELAAARA